VLAVMWMSPADIELPTTPVRRVAPVAGWSPEADASAQPEVTLVAVLAGAATLFFGLYPTPLFDLARDVGQAFSGIF
jgi:NADH-quinone oxidoreductase subunit N